MTTSDDGIPLKAFPTVTAGQAATCSRHRLRAIALAGMALVLIPGAAWWLMSWYPSHLLRQARASQLARDFERAEQSAAAAMAWGAVDADAALIAAESAAEQQKYDTAIRYLERMRSTDRRNRLRAALLAGDLNLHRLHRISAAEIAYRDALVLAPDHIEANTQLARLLGLCGRMREAVPSILGLVRAGVATDLLVLLAKDSGVVHDSEALTLAQRADPDDPDMLMGRAWHAANVGNHDDAISLLQRAIQRQPDLAAAQIALGHQLLVTRRYSELSDWLASVPPSVAHHPETWLIRAASADDSGDVPGAIRCYWEGLRLAPEARSAMASLTRLLARAGESELAERFADQLRRNQSLETVQNRVLLATDRESIDDLLELAHAYEHAGRMWEAYGWCLFAMQLDESHSEARQYLMSLRNQVRVMPLQLVCDAANIARSIDLSRYPLPEPYRSRTVPPPSAADSTAALSMRDDASAVGFDFRYSNGVEHVSTHRMFEFTGGGLAVLDYDRDGFVDIFCTQGHPWSGKAIAAEVGDRLFRNRAGERFAEVSRPAGLDETGFGQGATIGDFNSDGFADIYVANIGANQLWMNHGDGTYRDVTAAAGVAGDDWTTSCVLADLNADGLPDIYAVNYVTDDDVFSRVCRSGDGSPTICMPFDFHGQRDRLWLNDGNGRFTDATATALSIDPTGMGLGVAVWDAHGQGRLSLLVANDTTPNFFFVNEIKSGEQFHLNERGIEAGLGLTGDGKATGCMGVALGDINGDGFIDLNVTNFLGESNTLYVSSPAVGIFEDQTEAMGLKRPTARVVGFGTQFLDLDLDGQFELFMTNGHIDDLTGIGRPYRMPPLLFRMPQKQFAEVNAGDIGPYFQRDWVGRSAVRLDWNRDGREDLAIGHLHDPYALLTNTTATGNRYLSIQLAGVQSSRDAIGTTLRARIGQRTIVRQLTAGDGYQASNERRVIFGLGASENVDDLEVHWPSGSVQRFEHLPASQELLIIEGRQSVWAIPSPNP